MTYVKDKLNLPDKGLDFFFVVCITERGNKSRKYQGGKTGLIDLWEMRDLKD